MSHNNDECIKCGNALRGNELETCEACLEKSMNKYQYYKDMEEFDEETVNDIEREAIQGENTSGSFKVPTVEDFDDIPF